MSAEHIVKFTRQEGGNWGRQPHKLPPDNVLERLVLAPCGRSRNGCKVTSELSMGLMHSFVTSGGRRWDCINGWTDQEGQF